LVDQIVVRLEPKVNRLIRSVARARGQDVSNFVRAVIKAELGRLSYLSSDEKKALGIQTKMEVAQQEN
jgi:hypothetical protein